MEKKQKRIKDINDEKADSDQRVKTAQEKKDFWKAKAAAIKNATEMEKEEAEKDEKDYEEMRKVTPGVSNKIVEYTKGKMADDKKAQDRRINEWNRKVLRSHPAYRAPEPEKKEADKDPKKADSDAAVDEMKMERMKNKPKEVDPKKQLTAQISAPKQKSFTDNKGEHVHFAQTEEKPKASHWFW